VIDFIAGTLPDNTVGWSLQPDANAPVFFEITAVEGNQIEVRGDAESQVSVDETPSWYFIVPPVGVSTVTGALDLALCAYPSRYLAFHYLYMFPQVGVHLEQGEQGVPETGTYGAQPGPNKSGQYQAWHRNYNPTTARWTTPDPAASPWTNLVGYVGNNPVGKSDPSGLQTVERVGTGKIGDVWTESKEYPVNDECGTFRITTKVRAGRAGVVGSEAHHQVRVEYHPHNSDPVRPLCCLCDNIRMIQFVRVVKDGVYVAVGDPGTVAGQEMASGDARRESRGERMKEYAGKDGWAVDQYPTEFDRGRKLEPWYKGGHGANAPQAGYRKVEGSRVARIYDTPILPLVARNGRFTQEFTACAVCDTGTTQYCGMTVLGCISWRVRHLANTPAGSDTRQVVEVLGSSDEMAEYQRAALRRYNK